MFIDSTTDFTVDASPVSPTGDGNLRAIITGPSGTKNDTVVTNNEDGTYKVAYAPYEEGMYSISRATYCTYTHTCIFWKPVSIFMQTSLLDGLRNRIQVEV